MEPFTTTGLIKQLRLAVESHPDNRSGNNLQYTLLDAVLGAFSAFFIQSPSFLAYQRTMQETQGRNNAQSLFSLVNIPSDNQIRNLLDDLPAKLFHPVFRYCVEGINETGILDSFRTESGNLIIAIDGTGYFSSEKIHCDNCTIKMYDKESDKPKRRYEHTVLTPVIVSTQTTDVIPLEPEHIIPQDGEDKQDCENKAAKRWLKDHGAYYAQYNATVVGDDLYAHQPLCKELQSFGLHFILVCKPESHKSLYTWINELEDGDKKTVSIRSWDEKINTHTIATYSFANNVPLRDTDDTIRVNWIEVTIKDEKTDKQIYHNSFITDHILTEKTAPEIVVTGRARWHIENGNNNTLKTKGYNFEHNYGHGKKTLSLILTTLIIIAFLFHTMLSHTSEAYQNLREKLPRQTFFAHIQALTSYLYFDNWDHLFAFMEQGLKKRFAIKDLGSMLKPSPG